MKVINLGTDIKALDKNSSTYKRMISYGKMFDSFHVVILASRKMLFNSDGIHFYGTGGVNKIFQMFRAFFLIKRIIKNQGRDGLVISAQDPFELSLVAALSGTPFQVQLHTDIGSLFWRKKIINKIRAAIAKFVFSRASGVRVVSEKIKAILIRDYNVPASKISVLPIRADLSDVQFVRPKSFAEFHPAIVTVARFEKEKNVIASLKVLREVIKRCPQAGLVLVGDGSLRGGLEKFVRRYNLSGNVVFAGKVPNARPFIKGADIVLVLSYYEGYSLVLAEAAALGVPIVTTDVGIVGEILEPGKAVLTCSCDDIDCLASSIEKIVKDESLRNALVDNARAAILKTVPDEKTYLDKYKDGLGYCLRSDSSIQ
ncbi:MAG TPA: glycosyltransferase [Candidatus Paceibacterota bacterium]|nr:glycosyltransferase [Candidatus Paceibacterota bacterium]HRZ34702.1 glycosyltransferase [Candidatus Paceibacterota bacterium]